MTKTAAASESSRGRGVRAGALPNLIVIGAQKCGTTALHYYLDLHPETSMSHPKELNFFIEGRRGNWSRGVDWYARHFSAAAAIRGESSPSYTGTTATAAMVAERMRSIVPDAKLIFMVRDPIERAISHYLHFYAEGWERRDIEEALADLGSPYLERGRYHSMLKPFLDRYGMSRLLVISQEELLRRRRETVRAVYEFAGIGASFWSPKMERERNRSEGRGGRSAAVRRVERTRLGRLSYRLPEEVKWGAERVLALPGRRRERPVLDAAVRERIAAHLREEVARLRAVVGRDFPEWSV